MARLWHSIRDELDVNDTALDPGVLTHNQFINFLYADGILITACAILGAVCNAVNITVFSKMKPLDGVTVSFLGLALSDFLVSIFAMGFGLSIPFFAFELRSGIVFKVDPYILRIYCGNLMTMCYTVTMLTSAFIALTRCMCIAKPLQFKQAFTAKRTILYLTASAVFASGVYLPVIATTGVVGRFDSNLNDTRYVVFFQPIRKVVRSNQFLLTQAILPLSTQILITVCAMIMAWHFKKSLRFRQSMMSTKEVDGFGGGGGGGGGVVENSTSPKPSGKDIQVLRQVFQICVVYVVFNTPLIINTLTVMLVSGYDNNPKEDRYARLHAVVLPLRRLSEQLNSAVNFFIYLNYNARFRVILLGPSSAK